MELWLQITRGGVISGQAFDELGHKIDTDNWITELELDSTVDKIHGVVVTAKYPKVSEKSRNGYGMRTWELLDDEVIITGDEFYYDKRNWEKGPLLKAMANKTAPPTPLADKAPEVPAPVEAVPADTADLADLIAVAVTAALKARG